MSGDIDDSPSAVPSAATPPAPAAPLSLAPLYARCVWGLTIQARSRQLVQAKVHPRFAGQDFYAESLEIAPNVVSARSFKARLQPNPSQHG